MKQAIVLGLALAANAMTADQVDNELIVAPSGGKFGDLGKFTTKMSRVMFDEQADDELLALKEKKPYLEESKHAIFPRGQRERERKLREQMKLKESNQAADDEELFHSPSGKYPNKLNGAVVLADDELLIRPVVQADDDEFIAMLLPKDHFKTEEEYQKYVARMRFSRDDAADDELLLQYHYASDGRATAYNHHYDKVSKTFTVTKMDDDEFFVAPQGKLADLAKKYPGMIMFDEQADDELLALKEKKPYFEESKHAIFLRGQRERERKLREQMKLKESTQAADDEELFYSPQGLYPNKLAGVVMRDEVADDELRVRPLATADDELFVAPQGKLADLAKKYPRMIMFDEEADSELRIINGVPVDEYGYPIRGGPIARFDDQGDDELFVMDHAIPEQYKHLAPKNLHIYRSEEADDELLIRPIVQADDDEFIAMLLPREHFKTEEEYQKYVARMRFSRDDAADDELWGAPERKFDSIKYVTAFRNCWGPPLKPESKALIKDDELRAIDNLPRDEFGRIVRPPYARFDEVADDELAFIPKAPRVFGDKDLLKSVKLSTSQALVRGDDEADDELVYLGNLMRYLENEKIAAAAHTFDDDELRAEKTSHVKAQEMKQMKKKLRPTDETAFLA